MWSRRDTAGVVSLVGGVDGCWPTVIRIQCYVAAWYAAELGQYEVAEKMDRAGLKERESLLGLEHGDTLSSVSNLALVLQSQGKYKAAEAMNRRALEGREKALGKDHPNTLTSVYNLAYLLGHLCRYDEALLLYQRASSGYTKSIGSGHPTTQACLGNQAVLQHQLDAEAVDGARWEVTEGSPCLSPSPSPHRNPRLSPPIILDGSHSKPELM